MFLHTIARFCLRRKIESLIGVRTTAFGRFSTFFERESTIYALSSGYGKCGVAVIRVSGTKTRQVITDMTKKDKLPSPREAVLTTLMDPKTGNPLDKALVLWFPAPNSFTGEDVCELHVHGGSAVIASVFKSLSRIPGLRQAEPGDYTKRAFLNGKLDLTEVEGLGDLIHAETEEQRKQAFKQMEGRLKSVVEVWSKELLRCLAYIEAYIDFGEDQHIEDGVLDEVASKVANLAEKIEIHLNDKRRGERLRTGVKLAIVGKPNVGKSSLLNLVTARPAAIVSPIPGTTRDVVETTLDIDGFPVILSDTAGLRDTSDIIEIEGVRRAMVKATEADLVLYVLEAIEACKMTPTEIKEKSLSQIHTETTTDSDQRIVFVINKSDLLAEKDVQNLKNVLGHFPYPTTILSCQTEEGFENFLNTLAGELKSLCSDNNASIYSPSLTQERHRTHVSNCLHEMKNCMTVIDTDVVFAAEYLRLAMNEIGKLTGKIGAEDILDIIFKDFCIGK